MATYNVNLLSSIVDDFGKGQAYLADVDLDIVPEENNIDPLEALKLYEGERSIENGLRLATLLCVNKEIAFTKGSIPLLKFTPVTGKAIQSYFVEKPYLLEILCSTCWGILLKKLTPPLTDSMNAGGRLIP